MKRRAFASKQASRKGFSDDSADESAAEPLCNGPLNELMGCISRFRVDLLRVPLEPAPLSLDAAFEAFACPLSLRIAAPRALTAADVTFDVSQPWCHPYRLVRVAVRFPVEYESLGSADWSAAIECFIGNMSVDS